MRLWRRPLELDQSDLLVTLDRKVRGLLMEKRNGSKRATIFRYLSTVLAVALSVTLIAAFIDKAYSVPTPVQAVRYDGITLYRGLFFGSGPVASKIPSIGKVAPYFPAEYKNLEGQITRYIQAKDPNYFNRFAVEIQSGDRLRVAEAIRNTNKLQKEAMIAATRDSRTAFAAQVRRLSDQRRPSAEPEPEVIKDFATCIILFAHIVTENVGGIKPPLRELKGLSFEKFVDEIVRAVPRT